MRIIKTFMVLVLFLSLFSEPIFSEKESSRFSRFRSWVSQHKKPLMYTAVGGLAAYGGYRGVRSLLNLSLKNSIVGGAVAAYATYRASQFFFNLTSHSVMKQLFEIAKLVGFGGSIIDLAKKGTAVLPAHGIFSGPEACLASIREFVNKLEEKSEEDSDTENKGEVSQNPVDEQKVDEQKEERQGDLKTVAEWLEEFKKSKDSPYQFNMGGEFESAWKELQQTHGEQAVSKEVVEQWLEEYSKKKDEQIEDESLIEEPIVELGGEPVFESAWSEQQTEIQPNVITESPSDVQPIKLEISEYEDFQPQETSLSKEEAEKMEKIWREIENLKKQGSRWISDFKEFNAQQAEGEKLTAEELNLFEAGWEKIKNKSVKDLKAVVAKINQVAKNCDENKKSLERERSLMERNSPERRPQERLEGIMRHFAPPSSTQKTGPEEVLSGKLQSRL